MIKTSKRQLLGLISLVLFPITLFYFSPYLIIMGGFHGIVSGSAIIFSLQFISGIFLGRYFCSYLCPAGAYQDILGHYYNKKTKVIINRIKYFIWVPWLIFIIFLYIKAPKLNVEFGYQTTNYMSLSAPHSYIIYVGIIALFTVLGLTLGKRGACHSICWMAPFMVLGRKFGELLRIPSFKLTHNNGCIDCKQCNRVCPMSIDVHAFAKNDQDLSSECINCSDCIHSCPNKTLSIQYRR